MKNSNGSDAKIIFEQLAEYSKLSRGLAVSRQEGIDEFPYLHECVSFRA